MSALKNFRTMSGPERRTACRAHLVKHHGVDFSHGDPHGVGISGLTACADMAKAICWRKRVSSSMSLGAAFYVYLCRDVAQPKHAKAAQGDPRKAGKRFNFNFAKEARV